MKYSVYYNNNVKSNKVAEFDSLEGARAYCAKNTKGCDEVCAEDNCYEHNNNFWYEVYKGEDCAIYDEDGEVADLKQTVYETERFYYD